MVFAAEILSISGLCQMSTFQGHVAGPQVRIQCRACRLSPQILGLLFETRSWQTRSVCSEQRKCFKCLLLWTQDVVCRAVLARNNFIESRNFSRKILRNCPRNMTPPFYGSKNTYLQNSPPNLPHNFPAKNPKFTDELLQKCRESTVYIRQNLLSPNHIIAVTTLELRTQGCMRSPPNIGVRR